MRVDLIGASLIAIWFGEKGFLRFGFDLKLLIAATRIVDHLFAGSLGVLMAISC
jgi:hypothetical protein